ncbi:YIP1 family protein [Paenibacillus filicis]|uniref:YIP1 family protein n=1 Tax=Paenibacillus gyeongsangnamensis TaxID=3388067 RepID=A0ABT4Q449_9BACL|nr:YIP1 family protein [Paenibacillus filicis]MCZ8511638.1 YIP1 family protein [Paenibacillus filicis]
MKAQTSGRILLFLSMMLLMAAGMPLTSFADVVYWTNTKDSNGHLIWTQPAYYPVRMIGTNLTLPDKNRPGVMIPSPMQNPKDLFIDSHDHIYAADTGNNRIVEFGSDGSWLRYITVPESPLNKPQGLFVTKDGDIYVADTGNKRVVRLDQNGKLIKQYNRPESNFIPQSFKYDPVRLVVDKRGFLYIQTLGGYQGLLQLDPDGNFQGFYGGNQTNLSLLDLFKRFVYTRQMYASQISKLPGAISSVAVDRDGFIYTTTVGQDINKDQIKKLNIRGLNMFDTKDENTGGSTSRTFGEVRPWDAANLSGLGAQGAITPQLIDLCVDSNGNITTIDATFKYLNQYDASGNLLFFWAGPSSANTTQLGLMKNPVAIDANSQNDLYVLDDRENVIQQFRLSEFGKKVNEANNLTLQGRYEESEKPWEDVLRLNANYTPALLGLGKAAYKRGDYARAMELFKLGGSHMGYSEALWQVRLQWFQRYFPWFSTVMLTAAVLYKALETSTRNAAWRIRWRGRRRSQKPLIVQLKHAFYILKHPIDGFSAIRYESKGSYPSAFILLGGALLSVAATDLYTGFSFNTIDTHELNLAAVFLEVASLWIGWVVSNYLVSSIYRGEGRFKDVFVASAYALIPLIMIGIPLAVFSNVMTDSEQSIYSFLKLGMYVWMALLFIWQIQSLQNYTIGETIANIVLSLLVFMVLCIVVMVTLGLSSDLKDFIIEVYREVRWR